MIVGNSGKPLNFPYSFPVNLELPKNRKGAEAETGREVEGQVHVWNGGRRQ